MKLQRVLMLKMSGEDVRHMQLKLKELGFHKGRVDGNFGQDTLVSVSNFQRDAGFKADGVVSLLTWSRLNNYEKAETKVIDEIPYDICYVTDDGLKLYDSKLDEQYFYTNKTKKTTIWIKSTLSSLSPNNYIGNWSKVYDRDKDGSLLEEELKNSTHYTIGGFSKNDTKWDGKVIRNFEEKFWSYHSPFLNTTKRLNQSIISIELCNLGPLLNIGGSFYTRDGQLVDESEVVELDFRGYKFWHKYTDKQIESLRKLLTYLVKKWDIDTSKSEIDFNWFEYHKKWESPVGLRTDSQISYEKIGIFPQDEIIQILSSL